jgi:type VI secretion system protein ImpA
MALREDILNPISEETPCGIPAAQVSGFDKLRDLRKPNDQAVEAFLKARQPGEPPKVMTREIWAPKELNKLLQSLAEMLATRSKDLELAVWLLEALIWREGLAGLADGLQLVHRLLDTYWDQLHPLPDEGDYYMRVRHLEWIGMSDNPRESSPSLALGFAVVTASGFTVNQYWTSRSIPYEAGISGNAVKTRKDALAEGKISPEDFDSGFETTPKAFYKQLHAEAVRCTEALNALEAFCTERFRQDPPGFVKLKAALERTEGAVRILLDKKLEKDPDPIETKVAETTETPAEGGEAAAESAPAAPSFAHVFTDSDVSGLEPKSWQEAVVRIAAAARYMRRRSPAHPSSYLVLRGLRWGELYAAGATVPPADLAAPPLEARSSLRNLAMQNRWPDVIEAAEAAMAAECGRGWLDLQRYAIQACDKAGHAAVARALRSALTRLLADYPTLAAMTMTDDTGTANPDTIAWLNAKMGEGG